MAFNTSSCINVSDTKICPHCKASTLIKNGFTVNRKQQFYCKTCTKRCIDFYTNNGYGKENNTYNPAELAIRFKHRLVSIHCFANGNGRHSRLMADLIMEKIYDSTFFSWGSSKLVKATETRSNYIQAVRKADNNDIEPLISFAKS